MSTRARVFIVTVEDRSGRFMIQRNFKAMMFDQIRPFEMPFQPNPKEKTFQRAWKANMKTIRYKKLSRNQGPKF